MIAWRRVPWTLWAFAVLTVAGVIVFLARATGDIPVTALIIYVVLISAWLYFLLRGVRWVWMITVGVELVGSLFDLITGSGTWLGISSGLVGLLVVSEWVTVFDSQTFGVIGWQVLSNVLLTWLAMAFTSLTRSQAFVLVSIFLWPLLVEYGYTPTRETLNVGIWQATVGVPENLLIAASAMAAVPTLIFFLFFQRNILSGLTAGSLKG